MAIDPYGAASRGDTVDRTLNGLLGDAEDRLDKAKEVVSRAQEAFLKAKDKASDGALRVGDFARDRPYAALAISAFVGVILGHMISAHRPTVVVVRGSHLSH